MLAVVFLGGRYRVRGFPRRRVLYVVAVPLIENCDKSAIDSLPFLVEGVAVSPPTVALRNRDRLAG